MNINALMLPAALSLGLSIGLTYIIRRWAKARGNVVPARSDRWHKRPTPIFGGIAIFIAFSVALISSTPFSELPLGLLIGAAAVFLVGLADDIKPLSPPAKLIGIIISAAIIVFTGNVTAFFDSPLANIALTFFWLVAVSNALNLVDNMDGLAGGVALVASLFLAVFFFRADNFLFLLISISLFFSVLGFWIFNFPPASIFMGDSGSLFLGMLLAALSVARQPQASNLFAIIGIPALVLLLPIIDTTLVSMTRVLRGASPAQGGKDHLSHRLVLLGLSERQVLFLLLGISALAGILAIVIENISYSLSLIIVPLLVISLALFAGYLGQLKLKDAPEKKEGSGFYRNLGRLLIHFRVFEISLDFFLILISYYLAFGLRFGFPLIPRNTSLYLNSVPILVSSVFLSFFVFGIYKLIWRYISLSAVFDILRGAIGGAVLSVIGLLYFFRFAGYSRQVFLFFPVILFLLVAASRFSFRYLETVFPSSLARKGKASPVLIYGAGDAGELILREIKRNHALGMLPIGFIDDRASLKGKTIQGVKILGTSDSIADILKGQEISGLIISSDSIDLKDSNLLAECEQRGIWIKKFSIGFSDYSPS